MSAALRGSCKVSPLPFSTRFSKILCYGKAFSQTRQVTPIDIKYSFHLLHRAIIWMVTVAHKSMQTQGSKACSFLVSVLTVISITSTSCLPKIMILKRTLIIESLKNGVVICTYCPAFHSVHSTYLFNTTFRSALPTSFPGTANAMSSTQVTWRAWAAGLGNSLNLQSQFGNGPGDLPAMGGDN